MINLSSREAEKTYKSIEKAILPPKDVNYVSNLLFCPCQSSDMNCLLFNEKNIVDGLLFVSNVFSVLSVISSEFWDFLLFLVNSFYLVIFRFFNVFRVAQNSVKYGPLVR